MSEPLTLWLPTALIAALAIPLAIKAVPPNRFFGIRTARTLGDRELWFRINRFAGCTFLLAAALTACIYVLAPALASGRSFVGMLSLVGPVIAALATVKTYGDRIDRRSD
jgi:uncharacterized membrane protein